MNISICITVFNEEKSIAALLDSLLAQSKKADEIVIVDGGSTDKTIDIIRHYQKKNSNIKILTEKCTRARGRNLSVEIAKNEIIAITDAGCVAAPNWLEKLTAPFINIEVDISAGFYKMIGKNPMQKAMSVFLGTQPKNFNVNFLPSTRSMAFRKSVWEKIGGFPEEKENSAEDTYFNFHTLELGMSYARVKSALVEWGMPDSISEFFNKIYTYAKWDAMTKIWFFPGKGLTSHNIKALFILLRYIIALSLIVLSFRYPLLPYFLVLFFLYLIWSFRKINLAFGDYKTALWGPALQIVADLAVIRGFLSGIIT